MALSRRLRGALIASAVLASAVLAVLFGAFPQDPLRRLAERRLRDTLGPAVRLGRLELVPARRLVRMADLRLAGAGWELEAPRVELVLGLGALLGGSLTLDSLEVASPRLVLRPSATVPSPRGGIPGPLTVRRVALSGGTLLYDDPALGGAISLQGIEARGSIGGGRLELTSTGGAWQRPRSLALGPLRVALRLSSGLDADIEELWLSTRGSRLTASGPLARRGRLAPEIAARLELDLDEWTRAFAGLPARGVLSGSARIEASRGEATLDGSALEVAGLRIDQLSLTAAHGPERSQLKAAARLLGGRVDADATLDQAQRLTARATASGLALERLRQDLAPALPRLAGQASGELRASGDLGRPLQLSARVESDFTAGRLTGRAVAEGQGHASVASRTLDLVWSARLEAAGGDASGRAMAEGRALGAWPPAIDGRLTAGLQLGARELTAAGHLQARGGTLQLDLAGQGLDGTFQASLAARDGSWSRLGLRGSGFDLARLAPGLEGHAAFDLEAQGPLERLGARGALHAEELAWRGAALGSMALALDGEAGVTRLVLDAPALKIHGTGRLATVRAPELTAELTFQNLPLSALGSLAPQGMALDGRATGAVELTLPLARPERGQASARIDALEASLAGVAVRARSPFRLVAGGAELAVSELALEAAGASLTAEGRIRAPDGALSGRLVLDADLAQAPLPEAWRGSGTVRADVTLAGHKDRPQAFGRVSLDSAALEAPRLPRIGPASAVAELTGDAIELHSASAVVASGSLGLSGRVPFAAVWPALRSQPGRLEPREEARLDVLWDGLAAAELLRALSPLHASAIEASLSGRARLQGGFATAAEVRLSVQLSETALRVGDLELQLQQASVELERGRLHTEGLRLAGLGGVLTLAGSADLTSRELDASLRGALDLRALSPLLPDTAIGGRAELDLTLGGTLESPRPHGFVAVSEGTLRLRDLPQALSEITARLAFDGRDLRLERARAVFGGGALTALGTASLEGLEPSGVDVSLIGTDLALRHPPGLRARLDADLSLTGGLGAYRIAGRASVTRGTYDLDVALEDSLRAQVAAPTESPVLRRVALDVRLDFARPVLVRGSLANLSASGGLAFRGTLERPEPHGRLDVLPGGKVQFQGREFEVDVGDLEYAGTWDPAVTLGAHTRVRGDDQDWMVGLRASGTLADTELQLSARGQSMQTRALSQAEILSLLATGESQGETWAASRALAGQQAAELFAGRVSRGLSRELQRIGIDEVKLQPELLARETDLGVRFTFGKRFGARTRLVYSFSLNAPEDRFARLSLDLPRSAQASAQLEADGSATWGLGQQLKLGGSGDGEVAVEEQQPRLGEVRFEGPPGLDPGVWRSVVRAREGRRASVFDLQDDADRLRERLIREGFLEAEVGVRVEDRDAVFLLRPGPRFSYRVTGMPDPPDLWPALRATLSEDEALDRGHDRLLQELRRRGHLRAAVSARAVDAEDGRTLLFEVAPGPRLALDDVRFPGAVRLSASELLRAAGGAGVLLTEPEQARARILEAYRRIQHLAAQMGAPRAVTSGASVRLEVPIDEGSPARLAVLRFEGTARDPGELARLAGLREGDAFDPARLEEAAARLTDHLLALGHPEARVAPRLEPLGPDVALVLQIREGPRATIGEVVVEGLDRTRPGFARRLLDLDIGTPLDPREIGRAEQRLLDSGLFRSAVTEISAETGRVRFRLREEAPFSVGYDVRWNGDAGLSGLADAEVRNLFGLGLTLGARYDRGSDFDQARASLHVPDLGVGALTIAALRRSESFEVTDFTGEPARNSRVTRGAELQDALPLPNRWQLLLGYRYRHVRFSSVIGEFTNRIASLTASVVRDTRDRALDPRRGRFWSLSLEAAPEWLASDLTFVKGFAQASFARPLGSRLVWAQAVRFGAARGLGGQDLDCPVLFTAGGPTSLRGFGVEEVGPSDPLCGIGGEAALVLNQELRASHSSGLGLAAFWDGGNVFERIGDLSLDWRHNLGVGLRYASPVGLLRLDLAVPLARREGEKAYRLYFSLGQAF